MFAEQKSICTACGHSHKLTAHHKIRRADGGSNVDSNLVGVCRECHDQIHGIGKGCQCHSAFPDYPAAAIASQAHWDIVVASWSGRMAVPRPERVTRQHRHEYLSYLSSDIFAERLRNALEESEPRCT